MPFAQQLRQQGRQEAIKDILEFQLKHKFGVVPEKYLQRIRAALDNTDNSSLQTWTMQLISAETLEEVFVD